MLTKINPSFKLIGLLIMTLSYTVTQSLRLNILMIALLLLIAIRERIPFKSILKILIPVTVAAFGFFMTALIFSQQALTSQSTGHMITTTDYAWLVSTRIYVFALMGMLFTFTTDTMDLMFSLRDQLKVPDLFIYGIFATVNLLPIITLEVKKNRLAFKARNQKVFPYSSKVLIPLFTKVILYSDHLTLAMISKDFGKSEQRSYYKTMHVSLSDYLFLLLSVLLMIVFILIR